ncbi:Glyoxalase/Bleomycin resistance protein/Dioxygenase superfamily protein [uncultured archaeon]|nr:Glyoxalase/Bleomycin resistance protein/Dioxygenase superfamily protein [uncultured archaeon]
MGFLHASIRVRDPKKSLAFYARLLGMKVTDKKSYMPGELVITLRSNDTGQSLRLMHYARNCELYKPYEKGDEMDHLTFQVPDARKAFNRLVAAGAPVAHGIWEGKDVTMGYVKDPDGIWVGLRSDNRKKKN